MSQLNEVPQPIVCDAYAEPQCHWEIRKGEPPVLADGRREACYYYRPPGRSTGVQQADEIGTRISLDLVEEIRKRVTAWQREGYAGGPLVVLYRTTQPDIAVQDTEALGGQTGLADKRLELLKGVVPQATRIALLTDFAEGAATQLAEARTASATLGVTPVVVEVAGADYPGAFAKMVAARASALAVLSSPVLHRDRRQIIALAARHRLPTIYQWREHAEDGGLMAYGASLSALSRRLATYIDRIFKGANPAELPIEQPTRYELVINLKTAKTLGLALPQSLLVRADHVIE